MKWQQAQAVHLFAATVCSKLHRPVMAKHEPSAPTRGTLPPETVDGSLRNRHDRTKRMLLMVAVFIVVSVWGCKPQTAALLYLKDFLIAERLP
jgi:hypothetical protein